MPTSYTVKKGDELNKIGTQFGVDPTKITGYKSGDPNLIYAGEVLSIPDKDASAQGGTSSYSAEVKNQLTADESSKNPFDVYGVDTLRTTLKDTQAKKDAAFKDLEGKQVSLFNDKYATSGLGEKKTKISALDQEIADLKSKRDDLIAGIRGNSNLSVSQMSGDIRKSADYYTNQINNKIAERNGVATEYNSGLGEIEKGIQRELSDKKLVYDKYAGDETNTSKKISEYVTALKAALEEEGKNERFDKQLENALRIAELRNTGKGSGSRKAFFNRVTGDLMGFYDSDGNVYDENGNIQKGQSIGDNAVTEEGDAVFGNDTGTESLDYQDGSEEDQPWYSKLFNFLKGN